LVGSNGDFRETMERAADLIGFELKKKKANGHTNDKIVATYDYTDETGDLLFQAVRLEPKRFLQRRPDGDGWAWNLNGVRIVPYRLPALIAAVENGRPIYVAEGEKDVDNLVAIGFAATTNPMGAGSWRAEFAAYFHGADIIVIHDNDDHGRRHGQQIAA